MQLRIFRWCECNHEFRLTIWRKDRQCEENPIEHGKIALRKPYETPPRFALPIFIFAQDSQAKSKWSTNPICYLPVTSGRADIG
jgi:hypothetical protein